MLLFIKIPCWIWEAGRAITASPRPSGININIDEITSADDMMLELSGALSARLKLSASASKSKKAVKRGRMNADKDAAQKA